MAFSFPPLPVTAMYSHLHVTATEEGQSDFQVRKFLAVSSTFIASQKNGKKKML